MSDKTLEQYRFVDSFLSHRLTNEEEETFLGYLQEDPAFLDYFRKNCDTDFCLRLSAKWLSGFPELGKRLATMRLEEEEILALSKDYAEIQSPFQDAKLSNGESLYAEIAAWERSVPALTSAENDQQVVSESGTTHRKQRGYHCPRPLFSKKTGDLLFALSILFFIFLVTFLSFDEMTRKHAISESEPPGFATISESLNAVWSTEGPRYKRGQGLSAGKLFLKSGIVQIQYKNGVDLLLEGPTELLLNDPMNSFCAKGKISAHVPKEAGGYEIVTPFASVVDRGTEFFLNVDNQKAEVSVIKGLVDFTPPNQMPHSLSEKMASLLDLSANMQSIVFDPNVFFSRMKFKKAREDYTRELSKKMGERSLLLNGRTDLLARYDFNQSNKGNFQNLASGPTRQGGDASVFASTTCEGPYNRTRAVRIAREKAKVDFSVPGTYRDLTLFLTVRPDKLDRTGSIILSTSDERNETSFVLQILYNGALKFRIQQPGEIGYLDLNSKPCFFRANYGTWFDLAVVVDSKNKNISLYMDDEKLTESSWPDPKPIKLRPITIGNSTDKTTKGESRFYGAVGEFMLFNSPLTQKDIQQIRQ